MTEDADLGVRLAASGWRDRRHRLDHRRGGAPPLRRVDAPAHPLVQGVDANLLVHARRPRKLARGAGLTGALALVFLLGSGVAAALINPFLVLGVLLDLWTQPASAPSLGTLVLELDQPLRARARLCQRHGRHSPSACVAAARARPMAVLPLVPVYWLMMSAAARRRCSTVIAPCRWEKTDHGLARTSHRRPRIIRLPARGSGAARRRPRRAAASG